ncbi:uncharacterized protein LOC121972174 [Zingiber officinale]|uniref:uncharacterized protein LOC121972174 n=2 Tax=Zingiber officinale TaxID=94328 RepID=UPI001C4CA4BF|nr:uncharacterized protein LOC121972174 [Zingiber officinale]
MAESGGGRGERRPVRCPNCDELLPGLANLTAHRCGDRSATSRARRDFPPTDFSLQRDTVGFNSREERDRLGFIPEFTSRRRPASNSDHRADGRRVERGSNYVVGRQPSSSKSLLSDSTSFSDDVAPAFCRMPEDHMKPNPLANYGDDCSKTKKNQSRKDGAELWSNDPLLLLRQLDELRDRISKSSEFLEKPRTKMPAVNERSVYYRRSHEILSKTKERVSVTEPYSSGMTNFPSDGYIHRQLDVVPLSSYHSDEFDLQRRKYKLLPESTPYSITNQGRFGLAQNSRVSSLGIQMFRMKEYNEGGARAAKSKTKEKHPCQAFAGATPFVICSSCFELLKLPQDNTLLVSKKLRRLRCGSCSEVFCVELIGKRLVISSHSPSLAVSKANDKVNQHEQYKAQTSSKSDVSSISEEHGVPCQAILPTDDNNSSPFTSSHVLMEQESIDLTDPENLKGLSVASNRSEHVENPDSTDVSAVADLLIQDSLSFLLSSQKDISETGSKKEHSDEEVRIYNDDKFHQSPEQGEEITGIDLSLNDYSSSSLDHNDIEKHQSQMGTEKTNDPSVLNTTLKDTPQIKMPAKAKRSQVSVNGYLIPDHLVRKAEKKAGSIFPGEYWYDWHAGFWGVMRQPCLGIIPPFIEEFNYPMPENCAGGNTGVILNGRELHRKDLNLLVSRGLPFSAGQPYILDFSGNLFDEISNEHLGNFGKLAPTVEKMRRGFGMRAPK